MEQRAGSIRVEPIDAEVAGRGHSTAYLYTLAFFSGMCVMAVELCASRLMAPFFGTSTFVWTNVIGIIMISLSAGYMIGGRLADRRPELGVLLRLLLVGSALLLIVPFVAPPLLRGLASGLRGVHSAFAFIFLGSLLGIVVLFAVPIAILAMTSPFLIRLIARERKVGDSAGLVFALSTVGSVLGTFLPILVFVPSLGTAKTILLFSAALLIVVALGFRQKRMTLPGIAAAALLFLPSPALHKTPGQLRETESAYQYIEVFDQGSLRFLAYNDALGYQTVANKAGPLTGIYYDYYSLLPLYADDYPRSALILGLGGGIIANQYRFFHPTIRVDGVEIDPTVIEIARSDFALTDRTRVHNQDARVFLRQSHDPYDIIVVDAYTQQVYIPFHLTSQEFFREVRADLSPGGILAMNVSAARDDSPLLVGITNTLKTVFREVYTFRVPDSFDNVVVASDRSMDFRTPDAVMDTPLQALAERCDRDFRGHAGDPAGRPFTDDWAPVEHMVDWQMLRQNRW